MDEFIRHVIALLALQHLSIGLQFQFAYRFRKANIAQGKDLSALPYQAAMISSGFYIWNHYERNCHFRFQYLGISAGNIFMV